MMSNIEQWVIRVVLLACVMGGSGYVQAERVVLQDPTMPPADVVARLNGEATAQASQFVLTGIKQDGKDSFAIINGDVVRLGSTFQGYRLRSVKQTHVILEDDARQKRTLEMNIVDFKKTTATESKHVKSIKPK